jgi:P-type Cu2+ transporter
LRKQGVFVRTRSLLDKVRCVRQVVFDKTGTVTFGGLVARADTDVPAAALSVLATMVASSNHPVSQAVLATLARRPFDPELAVDERVGEGLVCITPAGEWRLGGRGFCGLPPAAGARRECVLARDGALIASWELEEDFRAGAAAEIEALRRRGLGVHLFSGDRADRVARAAELLGLPAGAARGGMAPADKAAAIAAIDQHDTMMIGDGLNDAPAFAAAFCAGTPAMDRPVLPARADFCFRGAQAGAVRALFEVADLHAGVVRTNLGLALFYNATTLVLCFGAAMTPVLCAVLMPISSLVLVLQTSLRFRRARRPA